MPWRENTKDNLDIATARKVLDRELFGLGKPKKKIIEYLAMRKLKLDSKGPILCFAGPQGTEKISVAQSISNRSMGKKICQNCFRRGGVRDETEIRGHRRTYLDAIPFKIIHEIRRSGTKNPIFILDRD